MNSSYLLPVHFVANLIILLCCSAYPLWECRRDAVLGTSYDIRSSATDGNSNSMPPVGCTIRL